MKKLLTAIMCCTLLCSGCSMQEMKDEAQEEMQDMKEDVNEMMPSDKDADTSGYIGEEKAKELALQKAELSAENVTFDRVELENDNGTWQYEIEFRHENTEYNADISATDGKIISWEIDTEEP